MYARISCKLITLVCITTGEMNIINKKKMREYGVTNTLAHMTAVRRKTPFA